MLGVAGLITLLSACAPADEQVVSTPPPPAGTGTTVASIVLPGTSVATRPPTSLPTTSTPAAVSDPAALPPVIIGITGVTPSGPGGSALVGYDRRTRETVDLLTGTTLATLLPVGPAGPAETTIPDRADESPPKITAADLAPDGRHAAVAVSWAQRGRSLEALVVVDVAGAEAPRVLLPATGAQASPVRGAVRYSPDGTHLATNGETMSIVSAATGEVTATSIALPYPPAGLAWSPDGKRLAWGDHFERTMPPTITVARLADPATPASLAVAEHVDGTAPWWTPDGQLHPTDGGVRAVDTDAARAWVLGERFDEQTGARVSVWWPGTGGASAATAFADLPAGFVPLSW